MDHSSPVVWAKHLVKAAIEYFCERKTRCGILIDNSILKDGVLTSISEHRTDFIICISPGYVTQMEYGPTELEITVKFDDWWHAMVIPYEAILMVLAVGANKAVSEEGYLNMISVPPVVYPTNSNYVKRKKEERRVIDETQAIEGQPKQEELLSYINVHLFNRRRSDTGT